MPDILHQLRIEADPGRVYRALTREEGLAGWWTEDVEAEPEVGSVAEFGFNDRTVVFRMKVEELEPGQRVRWRCLEGDPEWEGTELTFELSPDDGATILDFGHRGWVSADGILPMCSYDWALYLTSLKTYVEEGEGAPHPG